MASNDDEDESFEDALENVAVTSEQDLAACIEQGSIALKLFLNNKFSQAKALCEPNADKSMYHALGFGTIMYIQAVMTFDMEDIEAAIKTLKNSIVVCNKFRRKTSVLETLAKVGSKPNYNALSEGEIHAELCYAECLLLRALLTFIQDENLVSFVKGGLKIRECYKVYKECNRILQNRQFGEEVHKAHFESGVQMGVGAFNLMISLLPGKILKLLEFVGFSGNKSRGLSELMKGSAKRASLRGPLCSIVLLAYHTVICYVLGLADGDIELASDILQPCIQQYPKGALFLFFAGRIEEVRGNIDEAIIRFEESIESQQEWRQFHHLCYWELMWCHCFKFDWLIAMKYAERLCKENRWSKATYTYHKAAFLMMCDNQTEETKTHLHYLFNEVPKLKQRIAGKSLPIEKFVVHKAKRCTEDKFDLVLPAFELVYIWNGFNILGKKTELLEPFLVIIEKKINELLQDKEKYVNFVDDYCLCLLLKGVCLKHRGQMFQAEQCFLEVVSLEKRIKLDTYLCPYATSELAILYMLQEDHGKVKTYIDRAKKNYKGYLLESRLHFRLHAVRLQLSTSENSSSSGAANDLESPCQAPQRKGEGDSNSWNSEENSTNL